MKLSICCLFLSYSACFGQNIQWATKVENYSSSYTKSSYLPNEILGEPNCMPQGGDIPASWAPSESEEDQFITVSFSNAVLAKQIIIVENYKPGSLKKIFAYDSQNKETLIKSYKPKATALESRIFSELLAMPLEIKAIKIVIDPSIDTSRNCIDAIGISSEITPFEPKINLPSDLLTTVIPTKLSNEVNSNLSELGPLVLADGKTILFSRATYSANPEEDTEEIWASEKDSSGNWKMAYKFPKALNSGKFNFVSAITPDGNTILLGNSFDENGQPKVGCCAFSHRTTDSWKMPKDLDVINYHNSSDKVSHTLSNSGKTMIIAAQRDDSLRAERDLYISFLQDDGKWSEPKSMGSTLNTSADDYAPFLASDDRTLYYATSGLPGYGKSDIFVSHRSGDDWFTWSKPQNLGSVVNTKSDDAYFSITASGEDAYFCSGSSDENMDIFKITLPKSQRPDVVVLVKGQVLDQKTNQPLAATVIYEDLETGKEIGRAESNPATGAYQVTLPEGVNYGFRAVLKGHVSVNQNLDIQKLATYKEKKQDLFLVPIEAGEVVRLNNLFFEYNKSDLKPESFPELNRLVKVLEENPTMKIEIHGHTDDVGPEEYNMKLSLIRSEEVFKFLSAKITHHHRLHVKAFGESKPKGPNSTEEERAMNRRVEFLILKK